MIPINLILSLVFGIGQLVIGMGLAVYAVTGGRWRLWRIFLAGLAGAWFAVSGATELFVSGMETSQRLTGMPDRAFFTLWRGRADTLLFGVTAALASIGLAYALAMLWGRMKRA
ncbi:MAG TPA: hypothetical protein VKQ36_06865 [Ktedonobacterales bacterium]|nr:hypothetical protein [Ktedonobacterales bacterium]